ncbi:hypothetical protein HYY69_03365 [Candidatus Woesearchaeota archaeon]|nr:hypothetical protein [Candidatus Woesearchaeota archaeon]
MVLSKNEYLMYGIVLFGVIILGIFVYNFLFTPENLPNTSISSALSLSTISTGNTDDGNVAIDLTPTKIEQGKLLVDLAANTHSVDLSQFDLKQIISLTFDGKSMKPVEAPALSGHHANGILVFNAGEALKSFTITIEGIPQEQRRVYQW